MPEVKELRYCGKDIQSGQEKGKQAYNQLMDDFQQRGRNHRQRYRAARLEEYQNRFHASSMKWLNQ